jgi:hypothetical protein
MGGVKLNLLYEHSQIEQRLKDDSAMRIEAVINALATSGAAHGRETRSRQVSGLAGFPRYPPFR